MWRGDTACNHALLRNGVTERGRLVATDRVADAMGLSQVSPPLAELGNPLDRRGYRAAMAARGLKTRHIASNAALIINI